MTSTKVGKEDKTYSGLTNYETWNVALHMDNERGTHDYWLERAKECIKEAVADTLFTKEEIAQRYLADEIKQEFTDGMPDLGASTYADLLNGAMSEVNWYEVAKHLIEDVNQ